MSNLAPHKQARVDAVALIRWQCNCASAPGHPTMPTCRGVDDHIPSCPAAPLMALLALSDRHDAILARNYVDRLRDALAESRQQATTETRQDPS